MLVLLLSSFSLIFSFSNYSHFDFFLFLLLEFLKLSKCLPLFKFFQKVTLSTDLMIIKFSNCYVLITFCALSSLASTLCNMLFKLVHRNTHLAEHTNLRTRITEFLMRFNKMLFTFEFSTELARNLKKWLKIKVKLH